MILDRNNCSQEGNGWIDCGDIKGRYYFCLNYLLKYYHRVSFYKKCTGIPQTTEHYVAIWQDANCSNTNMYYCYEGGSVRFLTTLKLLDSGFTA